MPFFITSLFLSLCLHVFLCFYEFEYETKYKNQDEKVSEHFKIKLLKFSNHKHSIKTEENKVSISDLRPMVLEHSLSRMTSLGAFGKKSEATSDSRATDIFNRINDRLGYPNVLVKNNIQGRVNVRMVFHNGIYSEDLTRIDTLNACLKVYVARVLRDLKNDQLMMAELTKSSYFAIDGTFEFELSTGHSKDIKEENGVKGNYLAFYRHRYGGESPYDQVHQVISSTVGHLDLMALWNHRPNFLKSEKLLVKEYFKNKELEEYKMDPSW